MESIAAEHRWSQLDSAGTAAYLVDILRKGPLWSASNINRSRNWSSSPNSTSIPPLPLYGSPAAYLGLLLAALVDFIVWWLCRNLLELPALELGADQVPVIREGQLPGRISHYDPNGRLSDEVAGISSKIVDAFSRILGTTNVIVSREGAAIHPANDTLIQGLNVFHDNMDMVQSTVAAGNTCSDMFNSWESKLEKDAEGISQDEKGEKYIFLLNNTYDVWQKMCFPGASFSDVELVSRLRGCLVAGQKLPSQI